MPRRRALKPAKPISDELFLRGAQGSATRAANLAEKRARADAVAAEDRARQRSQGAPKVSAEPTKEAQKRPLTPRESPSEQNFPPPLG